MKLYYFKPKSYDYEYFVMASNKTEAHKSLMKYLEKKFKSNESGNYLYGSEILAWKGVNPNDQSTFPSGYTLEEFEEGEIIQSEIS